MSSEQKILEQAPLTEAEAFDEVCPGLLPGCTGKCCVAFRNFSLTAADAVLKGQWGTVAGGTGDSFMRDDRMGDVRILLYHSSCIVLADETTRHHHARASR